MDIEQLPPHEKYWASPEPSKNGDETDTEVFAAVGQALSSWEVLESIVVNLFVLFAQSYSPAVIRAYGSIDSAIGRWNAMKAAADSCFSIHNVLEQDIKKFGTFHKHWQVAISRRNEIAHGIVTRVRIDDKDRGHFLCPARYNTKKTTLAMVIFPCNCREMKMNLDSCLESTVIPRAIFFILMRDSMSFIRRRFISAFT